MTIFKEVSFQQESQVLDVVGGPSHRVPGHSWCDITLSLPATAELGAVIHNYDMTDANKLRLIADSLDGGIEPAPPDEPERVEVATSPTGRRDMQI